MTYRPLPDEVTGPQCGLFDAVTIERTASEVGSPFSLTCRAAVSLDSVPVSAMGSAEYLFMKVAMKAPRMTKGE